MLLKLFKFEKNNININKNDVSFDKNDVNFDKMMSTLIKMTF